MLQIFGLEPACIKLSQVIKCFAFTYINVNENMGFWSTHIKGTTGDIYIDVSYLHTKDESRLRSNIYFLLYFLCPRARINSHVGQISLIYT